MFTLDDGRNLAFTFILLSSLFLLWGFCNGMIDVMDKHFQDELHLSKAQSAWVQFAHYLGYFLMAIPAGWLAAKLGYKGGIIVGLLIVALGGMWFIRPRSKPHGEAGCCLKQCCIRGVLAGVCLIATGLISRNGGQSVCDRLGKPEVCRHPHQSRAIVQWRRVDLRTHRRQHVFLCD